MFKYNNKILFVLFFITLCTFSTFYACPTGQSTVTVYCFLETDECETLVTYSYVHFWTIDDMTPGDHEDFYLQSDGNGTITHCFSLGKHYMCEGEFIGCNWPDVKCQSQFYPSNTNCALIIFYCGSKSCYCDVDPCQQDNPLKSFHLFGLTQNYPNPFNPATNINYVIPKTDNVTLKVYDVLGRLVATLVDEIKTEGEYNVNFNASNLASGVYIYTLETGKFRQSKKMFLAK